MKLMHLFEEKSPSPSSRRTELVKAFKSLGTDFKHGIDA